MILNINSRGFDLSESIKSSILSNASKLEKVFPRIRACHYTVEIPHKHRQKGAKFSARLEMSVPGKEIVVKKRQDDNLYHAINKVNHAAVAMLLEYSEQKNGKSKFRKRAKEMAVKAPGEKVLSEEAWNS